MVRKYGLVVALLLAACGDSSELGLDSNELAGYDKAALEKLVEDGQSDKAIKVIRAKEQLNIAGTDDFLVLADIYLGQFNGVAAQVAIEKARNSGAIRSQTALPMGSAYMLQRRLEDAKAELRNVMLSGSGGFEALMLQADLAVQGDDIELARKYYAAAAEMEPQNYRVDLGIALLELGEGNLDAAKAAAQVAHGKDDSNAMPEYIMGSVARAKGEPERAIELLNNSLELQSTYIHALLELIAAYMDVANIEKAEETLDRAIAIAPNYSITQFYAAFILAEKGNLQEAQETLLRTGDLIGVYPAATRLYGLVSFRAGKYSIASKYLQLFLDRYPEDREVRLSLAESLVRTGFPGPSLEVLKPLTVQDAADADAQAAAGAANVALGNGKEAAENYRKAIEYATEVKASENDDTNRQIKGSLISAQAIAEYRAGNRDRAIELMSGLEELGLLSSEHLTSIANMQLENAQYVDALATANKLLEKGGSDALAHNIKGSAYYRMNQMEDAVASLSKAIALKPDYQSALKNRAYAYSVLGNYQGTKADLKELVTKVAGDGQLYAKLGHTHLMLSEFSEARVALRTARQLLPNSAAVAANYGYALAQLGSYSEAIAATEAAFALAGFDKAFQAELRNTIIEYKAALEQKEKEQ
ncbi:tetratricopeptide repeat protein [Kordiimonas sp.]|uniref:tetratricopeptide repeat protein n=1 Tax=Kordiimonas sp. TaxID=1970157 RepID=UPI003A95A804